MYTKKQLTTIHPVITLTRLLYFLVQTFAHQVREWIFQTGGNIGIYQLEAIGSSCVALNFHPTCSFELKRDDDEQLDHFAIGEITDGRLQILQHTDK